MKLSGAVRLFRSGGADQIDQDFLRAQADMGDERVNRYRLAEDYYDLRRKAALSPLAKRWLEEHGIPWREGLTRKGVDMHARALGVEAFEVQDDPEASSWLSTTAWPAIDGPELQGTVHTKTVCLGDGFLIAGWNDRLSLPTLRFNRPHIIKATYDEETGEPLLFSKVWPTSAEAATNPSGRLIVRMNLYYPDRVEKWFSLSADEGSVWARHLDKDGDVWPVWCTDNGEEDGEPYGPIVIPFRRKALGDTYGRSKAREFIPFEDSLTKAVLDQFEVMHEQGWQQRWATGVRGEGDRLSVGPGEIMTLGNSDARLGQFDAADPAKLGAGIKDIMMRAAAMTSTPLHDLIEGEPPSGEALKTARMDLVTEARDNQVSFGGSWSRAMALLLRIAAAHGADEAPEVDPDAQIRPAWKNSEVRDELAEAQTATFYSELGVSNHTLMRRLGFDPDEEKRLRAAEQDAAPPPPPPPDGGRQ